MPRQRCPTGISPTVSLPDKAIDLVDEACAMVKTELDSMPAELDEMNHRITQLQIEEASLKKETDELSKQRLTALEKEMAELRDSFNSKKAQWGKREKRREQGAEPAR